MKAMTYKKNKNCLILNAKNSNFVMKMPFLWLFTMNTFSFYLLINVARTSISLSTVGLNFQFWQLAQRAYQTFSQFRRSLIRANACRQPNFEQMCHSAPHNRWFVGIDQHRKQPRYRVIVHRFHFLVIWMYCLLLSMGCIYSICLRYSSERNQLNE